MEGFLEEKKEGQGVLGKTALLLPLSHGQNRGGGAGDTWSAALGKRWRPGGGEKGEGSQVVRFPYLFRAEATCGGGTTAAGGGRLWLA